MVEFLMVDLESLWSKASSPSCCWGSGGGDMVRDVVLDGLSNAAGLSDCWKLGKADFACISWLSGGD